MQQSAAYPLVSGRDVLQRSGSCLAGGGVVLTLVQHTFVQTHHLWVPQPLHALWYPSDLGESGEILVLALPGKGRHREPLLSRVIVFRTTKS